MNKALIMTMIVLLALPVAITCLHKWNPDLGKKYWFMSMGASILVLGVLSTLAIFNLFFYTCVVLIVLLFVREASKNMFMATEGGLILGIYFGLWLSIPVGVLIYST